MGKDGLQPSNQSHRNGQRPSARRMARFSGVAGWTIDIN
jgi:hypothetical protein